ncbi:MAG TPA: MinD/ParA family protein [Nitrospiraceae bacterium]|jgi:flagellar biosynthesis protein FlhG|nr:MinD/ParA family protein [Nitrospiraceae bacterium]
MDRTKQPHATGCSLVAPHPGHVQVIAVTSGKGGVGKTNVVANLALALAQVGKKVLVMDADLGLGNIDVLLGLVPQFTLEHVLRGEKSLSDIVLVGPGGIGILPASSGIPQLTALTREQQVILQDELDRLAQSLDVLLIDTGAGISPTVTFFAAAAQEIIVVLSPEPTSLTDAYALIKVLSIQYRERRFRVLVNMAKSARDATEVFLKLQAATDRFLNSSVDYLGFIPADEYVPMAVTRQRAVVNLYPHAPASHAFRRLGNLVAQWKPSPVPKGGVQFLWQRLVRRPVE